MGPNIPLKAGQFRARWIGTVSATPGQPLGFVDVWVDGNRQINRRPIVAGEFAAEQNVIAEISFVLKRPTTNLEYQLYVDRDVKMVLERVNLESINLAAPSQTAR
jgi:hypothetical protein